MDKQIQAFLEEAFELLQELEQQLLDLLNSPANPEVTSAILRILHTLKGTSAMFAFSEVSDFVHKIEAIFVHFRNARQMIDKSLIDLFIASADAITKSLHEEPRQKLKAPHEITAQIQHWFDTLQGNVEQSESRSLKNEKVGSEQGGRMQADENLNLWQISFAPRPEFYESGNTPDRIIAELRELGSVEVLADTSHVPDFEELDPEKCFVSWQIRLSTSAEENVIRDVFIFVEDLAEIKIQEIKEKEIPAKTEEEAEMPEVVSEVPKAESKKPGPDQKPNEDVSRRIQKASALLATNDQDSSFFFLQNNTEKMIALLGDLVTVQAKLTQKAAVHGDPEMISISNELESITDELRDCAMHLSMFPIGTIFNEIQEGVEKAAGKSVSLSFSGAATEIDRSAFFIIKASFVQLFSTIGSFLAECNYSNFSRIEFSASHQVGKAQLDIKIIGDIEVVSQLSFLKEKTEPADEKSVLLKETFAELERKLLAVHGVTSFESSGEDNFTVRILIPLNLAIIESLMVQIGRGFFLLPLAEIEECIELSEDDQKKSYRKNVAVVRGQFVPYLHLREKFEITGQPPKVQQIVIMKLGQHRIGMVVDQVVGEYQTAIKSWGNFCNEVPGISGAAILGDGGIALLVDFRALIEEEKELLEQSLKDTSYGI